MDFVIVLLKINVNTNILFIIINKFSKKILLIPNKNSYKTENWTNIILKKFMRHDWKLSIIIMSNHDSKFVINFWKIIWQKLNTFLLITTIWHSQADGQSKRTNQIIEIAFKYHLTTYFNDNHDWNQIIFYIQMKHNNVWNFNIKFAFNEFLYNFKIHDFILNLLSNLSSENYSHLWQIKKNETVQIIVFNNIFVKNKYDKVHQKIIIKNFIYLKLHNEYKISDAESRKLSQQRCDPFRILEIFKSDLALKLKFFNIMNIHPIISITQIELIDSSENPYRRKTIPFSALINEKLNSELKYKIEHLITKRISIKTETKLKKSKYLIIWKKYKHEKNKWLNFFDLQHAQNFIQDFEKKHSNKSKKRGKFFKNC